MNAKGEVEVIDTSVAKSTISAAGTEPILSTVIVSYNTREMTIECLRILEAQMPNARCEVFVIDNASSDGSATAVAEAYPLVKLTVSETNVGFGAANNLALRRVRGKYVLLLNSDAFPKGDSVARMIAYMECHPKVGVLGPRLLNEDGTLQPSCWRFPSPTRAWIECLGIAAVAGCDSPFGDYYNWLHDVRREVDFVVGACMLVRREAIAQVGGFDERFFMYAEESDWQKRMWDAGWKVAFIPDAEVTHLGGASGRSEPVKVNHHFFHSLDLFNRKHYGLVGLVSFRVAMTVGCLIRIGLWSVLSLVPSYRAKALLKLRMQVWLAWRQATSWNIGQME